MPPHPRARKAAPRVPAAAPRAAVKDRTGKAALRVSKVTVYRLIENKELDAKRVGRNYRIPAHAAMEYLTSSHLTQDHHAEQTPQLAAPETANQQGKGAAQ